MHEFCISQDTVVTLFRCGGYLYKRLCEISWRFCVPKITQIGCFSTGLFQQEKCGDFLRRGVQLWTQATLSLQLLCQLCLLPSVGW